MTFRLPRIWTRCPERSRNRRIAPKGPYGTTFRAMSLDVRLGQRQEQRLALLPQMLQSIEVLQLAAVDLVQFLEQELQQNETLELREEPGDAPDAPEPKQREEAE